ncbi:DUF6265 family protein [Ramlibacter albus]|uniref:DUF6265 domain-containing protein n=1 Tax=Ramlibacter albus TaxID=2079448 RepID=A0A923M7C5_9BURK|nr:DUF6265 family protein [Ramlibacter albus]MBC5763907.1 hypothetical protein [Ramlibacter albus]
MRTAAVVAAVLLVAGSARAQDSLAPLSWLAGCWKAENGEPGSGEQWMPLAGDTMMGVSRTVRGGKTVTWEFMRIARREDGAYAFFAQPAGRPPDNFKVVELNAQQVVFENPAHEFPQKIVYRLEAPGKLAAHIEGVRNGNPRKIEFPMLKVPCPQ